MKTFEEWWNAGGSPICEDSREHLAHWAWNACAAQYKAELTDASCTIRCQEERINELEGNLEDFLAIKKSLRELEEKYLDLILKMPIVKELPDEDGEWWEWVNDRWMMTFICERQSWQIGLAETDCGIPQKGRWVKAQEPRV